jgi:hypothetical protein
VDEGGREASDGVREVDLLGRDSPAYSDLTMPVKYDPQPERFRGTGIVYLSFNDEDGKYGGYWDLGRPDPHLWKNAQGHRQPSTLSAGGAHALQW